MNDRHFYLTLPSNSSKAVYGKQHPSNFKTKLSHAISLDPAEWEVGLAEISYPKSWNNLPHCSFRLSHPDHSVPPGLMGVPSMYTVKGFGDTRFLTSRHIVRDLQQSIRAALPSGDGDNVVRVKYDEVANRAKFALKKDYGLWLEKPLASILGLSSKMATKTTREGAARRGPWGLLVPDIRNYEPHADETVTVAPYTINVDRLIPSIYVYCDLVEQCFVGDSFVKLLRVLTVPSEGGDHVTQKFTNVHYSNLQTGNFESIEIKLTDSLGEPIDFKHGDVIVKLHFQRKTQ